MSYPNTGEALRGLRSLLQSLVATARSGRQLRREDLEALNAYLACDSVIRRVERHRDGYRMTLVPVKSTIQAVMAQIAASFAEVLVEGDPGRIKICENDDCKWVFYDRSRSRTRRWCAGADGCGNLLKVRRFRERQKKGKGKLST